MENTEELYEEFFDRRGVPKILHYKTPVWPRLTAKIRSNFATRRHKWALGDKYWKIADQYYGDPKLWWVIAWYNEKPTESHITAGMTILIPTPVEKALSYFNYGTG
jgi:nucleoid-associated protein YgaU